MQTPGKRRGRWMIGAILCGTAIYWVVFLAPLPFLASWWDVDTARGTLLKTRYRIADRIASSGRLDDMNRQEVIALLGKQTTTDKFRDFDLVYVLGPERGIGVDYEWLLIDFDQTGKVSKVEVTTD